MKKHLLNISVASTLLSTSCGWLFDDTESDLEDLGEAIGEGISCSFFTLGGNIVMTDDLNDFEKKFGGYSENDTIPFVNSNGGSFNMIVKTDSNYYATKAGYVHYKDSVDKCSYYKINDDSAISGFKVHYIKLESDDGNTDIEFILNDAGNHASTYEYNNDCDPSCTEYAYTLNKEKSTITFKMNGETCYLIAEIRFEEKKDSTILIPDQLLTVKSPVDLPPQEGKLGCDIARIEFSPKGTLLNIDFKDGHSISQDSQK